MTSRVTSALLCALCLLSATTTHATQQDDLDNLRKRIQSMQQEFEKTSESKSEAADALRESERAISTSNRKLHELTQQQAAARQTLSSLQRQSTQLDKDIQEEQALLSKLLYQQYLGGKQEYLKLLLNNRDPNQVARELQYYDYIARNRASWLNTLRKNSEKLQNVTTAAAAKSQEISSLQAEEQRQHGQLEREKQSRLDTLKKFSLQLRQQHREIGRLQHNENRLSQLVEKLSRMLAPPQSSNTPHNERLPDSNFDGKPFASLKGKLALPLKGRITNRFGENRPDSSLIWKGILLRADSGQPVKAIAAGRVVFADWLRGFGNLLIIDHGSGYMSLYGNNESLFKQVGDIVHSGENVASVGNSGGNEESGLYFELRYEGKPFDPMKWVSR